jgi:predicted  nucleic acid-binding Zn-ribbon protein
VSDLNGLLDVQALDLKVDQLHHRRDHLEERIQLVSLESRAVELGESQVKVGATVDELTRDQRRLEDEVASVEARQVEVDATMYGGSITSPKELQALQEELKSLGRRQLVLEDKVIELMEQLEPLTEEVTRLADEVETTGQAITTKTGAITVHEAEIASEIAQVEIDRRSAAEPLPEDLLTEYERLRSGFAGIAVARLEGGRCLGCNLSLSAMEVDRIKNGPPDAKVYCEECGRLLVR